MMLAFILTFFLLLLLYKELSRKGTKDFNIGIGFEVFILDITWKLSQMGDNWGSFIYKHGFHVWI